MSERLPDIHERGEAKCESWEAENHIRGNIYRCSCGREFDLSEGTTLSPDPYAIPVCPKCFEEWMQDHKSQEPSP